ncbi:MAG: flagellar motor protein MotB [Planctomycetota bacterium]
MPEWVVTYGDMMSLLLTFFIMLVSMSELKEEGRLRMMLDALNQRFGAMPGVAGVPGPSTQTNSAFENAASAGTRSEGGLKEASTEADGRGGAHPTVKRITQGGVVTLGGPASFGRFVSEPSEETVESTRTVARILDAIPNDIIVRGHATPEPLPAGHADRDAWDLSFRRALATARVLTDEGIAPEKLMISAAADTEPRYRGDEDAQAANRRVDVFMSETYTTGPSP